MTTPPKVSKFRIRRATRPADAAPAGAQPQSQPVDDGFGDEPFPTSDQDVLFGPNERTADEEIAAIKAEGLSGRQLRTARRVALKHGIEVSDEYAAVRILRRRGIDPFQPSAVLQLIESGRSEESEKIQLPQTVKQAPNLPAPPLEESQRAQEIMQIQRDIVRRRRRNFMLLLSRLAIFVLLPTLMTGWYYFRMATPFYATKSEFIIQQQESQGTGLGSMFRGTQFATSQDSIAVQGYLQSRDAMLRLDQDHGFKAHFSQEFIDPLQRLDAGASNEAAYKLYQRNVKIGYDPTEGLIKMEVIAADPTVSEEFSKALIGYAEEQVDQLSSRLREDQMKGARDSYRDAEGKMTAAQQKVLDLQETLGILDPRTEVERDHEPGRDLRGRIAEEAAGTAATAGQRGAEPGPRGWRQGRHLAARIADCRAPLATDRQYRDHDIARPGHRPAPDRRGRPRDAATDARPGAPAA